MLQTSIEESTERWFNDTSEFARKRQEIAAIIEELSLEKLTQSSQLLPTLNFPVLIPVTGSNVRNSHEADKTEEISAVSSSRSDTGADKNELILMSERDDVSSFVINDVTMISDNVDEEPNDEEIQEKQDPVVTTVPNSDNEENVTEEEVTTSSGDDSGNHAPDVTIYPGDDEPQEYTDEDLRPGIRARAIQTEIIIIKELQGDNPAQRDNSEEDEEDTPESPIFKSSRAETEPRKIASKLKILERDDSEKNSFEAASSPNSERSRLPGLSEIDRAKLKNLHHKEREKAFKILKMWDEKETSIDLTSDEELSFQGVKEIKSKGSASI